LQFTDAMQPHSDKIGSRRKALLEALLLAFLGSGISRSPHYRRSRFSTNLQFSLLNKCKLRSRLTVALRFQQFMRQQLTHPYDNHVLCDRVVQTGARQVSDATARTEQVIFMQRVRKMALYVFSAGIHCTVCGIYRFTLVLPYKCLNNKFTQVTVTFCYIFPDLPERMIPNADDPDSIISTNCH